MIKPIGDRVVIKVVEREEKTASGLFLPDTAKEKPQEGEIIVVGTGMFVGVFVVALDVNTGDRVIYSKYADTEEKNDSDENQILREADILAIVEK